MQKKCFPILLPTKREDRGTNGLYITEISNKLAFGEWWKIGKRNPQHLYICSDEEIKEGDWYIVNNILKQCKKIKQYTKTTESNNRYIVDSLDNEDNDFWCRKVIATTDNSLLLYDESKFIKSSPTAIHLPAIPKAFIEHYITEYNKGNVIKEVLVEYTCKTCNDVGELDAGVFKADCPNCHYKNHNPLFELKLINNEIVITSVKDSWTRVDMEACWNAGVKWGDANCEFGGETSLPKFDEWLNKNL